MLCGFKHNFLWTQGLKKLVLWFQNLATSADQGLWTQVPVLNRSARSLCQKDKGIFGQRDSERRGMHVCINELINGWIVHGMDS